jgi:hypothetical protein
MKIPKSEFKVLASIIILLLFSSCTRHYETVERTVNAVWNADNTQVLKVITTYETYDPSEVYYYAISGRNWKYRFELCNPDLSVQEILGTVKDIDMGGLLGSIPVYWLPASDNILLMNALQQAVVMDFKGKETLLEPPLQESGKIFIHNKNKSPRDYAPSPNEEVIAVYFQSSTYEGTNYVDLSYEHCVSFFSASTGNHIFTQKIPFVTIDPALNVTMQNHNRRCQFVWSADGSGVYVVTRDKSYFIRYGNNKGITEVQTVPERGTITKSGTISNNGKQLLISLDGNKTALDLVQLDDWKPIDSLGLIPEATNGYSFY